MELGKGQEAAKPLLKKGLKILPQDFKTLDVLVNNAGIFYDSWQKATDADFKVVREALETNTLGAWRMCQAFIPLLKASGHGRIVNVSSEAGSMANMGGGTPAYNVSKVAMNASTRMLASELKRSRILMNSACPGWVATEMGWRRRPSGERWCGRYCVGCHFAR